MLEVLLTLGFLILFLGTVVMFAFRAEGSLWNETTDTLQDPKDAIPAAQAASRDQSS